jgi:hypothetical protein
MLYPLRLLYQKITVLGTERNTPNTLYIVYTSTTLATAPSARDAYAARAHYTYIVSLKELILVGYIRQLKSRIKLWPKGGINGVVIATFERWIKGG